MGIDFYFVKGLYQAARLKGSPDIIEHLIDQSLTAMSGGPQMFSMLQSATVDGNTQIRKIFRDPPTLFAEASLALDYYNNGPQGSFGFDRSGAVGA